MRRPSSLALLALVSALAAGCPADEDEVTCPDGQTACGGVCYDLQSDPLSCGFCLHVCAEGADCVAGECLCPNGGAVCDGACVDLLGDAANCGGCGQACGLGTCAGGGCACAPAATDCQGNPACVDLQTDLANCGGCDVACKTRGVCDAGSCGCAGTYPDECATYCTSFASTTDCGGCGIACAAGGLCAAGSCACPGGEVVCGAVAGGSPGTCVDTATDEANCGQCGRRCATLATCTSSSCACPASSPDVCGVTSTSPGTCVNRQTDEANCGTCGTLCPSGATCAGGACSCPAAKPVACATQCCAGDRCCGTGGSACQPAHQNGLGGTYYSGCDEPYPPAETTEAAALRAADSWAPGTTYVGTTGCDVMCVGRQTATSCAVWCYGISGAAGRVGLNTINNSCAAACPTFGSPVWN